MPTPQTITLLGYDGTGPVPEIAEIWQTVIPELHAQFPDFHPDQLDIPGHPARHWGVDRVMERMHVWYIVKEHNEYVPHLRRYDEIERDASAALHHAAALYNDLHKNTTINWLAAHHNFVLATIDTRELLTARVTLARKITDMSADAVAKLAEKAGPGNDSLTSTYYNRHVPTDQQIKFPDPDNDQRTLDTFIDLSTERFRILRATITGTYPPGFGPTTDETDTTTEWAGRDVPIPRALAHADGAMRIPSPRAGDPEAHARSW